jgi:hypothetical protein
MRNSPIDMTALLIELMDRISDESLSNEKLATEIERGRAVADISKNVLAVWNLQLRLAQAKDSALNPESFDLPSSLKP